MLYTDDATLVQAAQATPAAFATLYERYHPLIFGYARRYTHSQMQAEDIAAETFLRALQALDRYEARGVPFSAWLFRITSNLLIQQGRHGRVLTFQPLTSDEEESSACAVEASQEEVVDQHECQAWLCTELRRLSADQQRALWFRFWQDYSIREVAVQLGRTEAATKILLYRALKRLRAQLQMSA
jgi:RNA polymerase sigma-70 factor (ECF subfamily)